MSAFSLIVTASIPRWYQQFLKVMLILASLSSIFRLGQLNTGQYLAGCISNIRLSNNGTGGMDSIRLNDARLLLYSKGTTFGRCLAQVSIDICLFPSTKLRCTRSLIFDAFIGSDFFACLWLADSKWRPFPWEWLCFGCDTFAVFENSAHRV